MKINLTNFQAHEKTSLDVQGSFVCVLGNSNAGKSSIVRAIRWLIYNSLRGTKFVRHGEKSAQVSISFEDCGVERSKGKALNSYKIGDLKLDTVGGSGVPVEVSKAVGIVPVSIEKDDLIELNVSNQLESPFLLMESDSYKSKALNVLTGGHVFDAAIRETNRLIKSLESDKKYSESSLKSLTEGLESFKGIEDQEKKIQELESRIVRYEFLVSQINTLVGLKTSKEKLLSDMILIGNEISNIESTISEVSPLLERMTFVDSVVGQAMEYKSLSNNVTFLRSDLGKVEEEIQKLSASILNFPDYVCGECGQVVSKTAREAMVV